MSNRKWPRRRVAVLVAVAAAAVAGLPASAEASATASTPKHHKSRTDCIVYEDLTEKVLGRTYTDNPPAGYSAGDTGTFNNQLISAQGAVLAAVAGTSLVVYVDATNIWTLIDNTDTFADGAVRSAGLWNAAKLSTGEWVSVPSVGISGPYAGKTGTRSFRATSTPNVYDSKLELC
jgi:Allene oxide cyclase barrel like domain